MTISDQHPSFAYFSRMRYISRWGLMYNTFQEDIQEHSHMVTMLAHTLAAIRRDVFGGNADPGLAVAAVLYHDALEILTGDLPTLIKYYNFDIRDACRGVRQFSAHKLLRMLPKALRPSFDPLLREDYSPGFRTLVRAADKLSAHIKCMEEFKAGSAEFKRAAGQTPETLQGYNLPKLGYFLEHFLLAFGLMLDEPQ